MLNPCQMISALSALAGHHDIQHDDTLHNDIQHNDTWHKGLFVTLSMNDIQPNKILIECRYAECRCAECRFRASFISLCAWYDLYESAKILKLSTDGARDKAMKKPYLVV